VTELPIPISIGAVAAAGTASNIGAKNDDNKNKMPHITVDIPVFAPALIPAADSGEMSTGIPDMQPLMTVAMPVMINNQRARGVEPV
jgi:hypothetical protein